MMQDHYMGTYTEVETVQGSAMRHLERMLDASQRRLYPGRSPDNTLLDFGVKMTEQKVEGKWSNKSLNNVMQIQRTVLPDGNLVPKSIYATKKIPRDFGPGYEHIDACENDRALFWKENTGLDKCPQRLELGLSQSKVSSSPVAQQQLIKKVLGKRVARRQGCRSMGIASVSSSTTIVLQW